MKLIDEKLGGTTPLRSYFKISQSKSKRISNEDDEFEAGMMKAVKMMKNIGLQKIKLIKLTKCS